MPDSIRGRKRVTCKRRHPNPHIHKLLITLREEAVKVNSALLPNLDKAIESFAKYPLPIRSAAECAIIKGFNKRLCEYIELHLDGEKVKNDNANIIASKVNLESVIATENSGLNQATCSNSGQKKNKNRIKSQTDKPPKRVSPKSKRKKSNEQNNTHETKDNTETSDEHVLMRLNFEKSNTCESHPNCNPTMQNTGLKDFSELLGEWDSLSNNNLSMKNKSCEDLVDLTSEETDKQTGQEEKHMKIPSSNTYIDLDEDIESNTECFQKKEDCRKLQNCMLSSKCSKLTLATNTPEILLQENNCMVIDEHKSVAHIDSVLSLDSGMSTPTIVSSNENEPSDFITMPPGTFEIVLLIDKHEHFEPSKSHKYKNELRSLTVGDFLWVARSKETGQELVLPYIVERKRMDDLASSIKDGRFHEQKFRLRKSGVRYIIYLIESHGRNKHVGLPLPTLKQALVNTCVHDNFLILNTESLPQTFKFLGGISERIAREGLSKNLRGCSREPQGNYLMTFEYFNKSSSKNKPLTVRETFIKMLLQLKGLSVEKALAITNKYATPFILIQAYGKCTGKEGELLLASLKYNNSRNVGPAVSKTIYQLFTKMQL